MSEAVEWRQFAEGERVICRPSPECRQPHKREEDGRVGTVSGVLGEREWQEIDEVTALDRAHRYLVEFDEPYPMRWRDDAPERIRRVLGDWTDGLFAANELDLA